MWFPLWLNGCVVMLVLAIAIGAARRLVRRAPNVTLDTAHGHLRRAWLAVGVAVVVALVCAAGMARSDLEWRLGIGVSLAVPSVFWACVIGVTTFAFTLTGALAVLTRDRRARAVVAGSLVVFCCLQSGVHFWTRPVWETIGARADNDGVVLQTSPVSCGAASAANVARALGQDRTEREMARLIGTTQAGSSAAQIARGLAAVGIECAPVQATTRGEVGAPAILFVDHPQGGPESHAVAVIARAGLTEVWDPLMGRTNPTDAELRAVWPGRALRCHR